MTEEELLAREKALAEREKELDQNLELYDAQYSSLRSKQEGAEQARLREEVFRRFPAIQELRPDFKPASNERDTLRLAQELNKTLEPSYRKLQAARAVEAYGSGAVGGGESSPTIDKHMQFASDFNRAKKDLYGMRLDGPAPSEVDQYVRERGGQHLLEAFRKSLGR